MLFQNENLSRQVSIKTLEPDFSSLALAEWSNSPEEWFLHSTGIFFTFDAKKALSTSILRTSTKSDTSSKLFPKDDLLEIESVEAIPPLESKSRQKIDEDFLQANFKIQYAI